MSKLVLIGGPPAVGKTTVLSLLPRHFESCACLDADDVWRVQPLDFRDMDEAMKTLSVGNVTSVLRGYLEARFSYVFLSWVLANPLLTQRLLDALQGVYETSLVLHLVATPEALEDRRRQQLERGRLPEYGFDRLRKIEALATPKIDTTGLSSEVVAERIAALVRGED